VVGGTRVGKKAGKVKFGLTTERGGKKCEKKASVRVGRGLRPTGIVEQIALGWPTPTPRDKHDTGFRQLANVQKQTGGCPWKNGGRGGPLRKRILLCPQPLTRPINRN